MVHQRFEVIRQLDHLSPEESIGYDIANVVALLFDKIAAERLRPSDADLTTLTVDRIPNAVRASIYVKVDWHPGVDRLNLIP